MGGAPRLENIDESLQTESDNTNTEFLRHLLLIMRKDAVTESESHIKSTPSAFSSKRLFDTSITFIQDFLRSWTMLTAAC